jgi:hypothetical protein
MTTLGGFFMLNTPGRSLRQLAATALALSTLIPHALRAEDESVTPKYIGQKYQETFKVPKRYNGQKIRVSGKEYLVQNGAVTVDVEHRKRQRAELLSALGRIEGETFNRLEDGGLNSLRRRDFRVHLNLNYVFGAERTFDRLFVRHEMAGYEVEVRYQPSFLGLSLSAGQIYGHSKIRIWRNDIRGKYRSEYARLLLNTEFAPISFGPMFFQRTHVALKAGPQIAQHYASVNDDEISISDEGIFYGYVYGTDIRIPIINNFWTTTSFTVIKQKLDLKKLNINDDIEQYQISLGGAYAF